MNKVTGIKTLTEILDLISATAGTRAFDCRELDQ
jgi:hypothetical protein